MHAIMVEKWVISFLGGGGAALPIVRRCPVGYVIVAFSPSNMVAFSPSNMVAFSPSNMVVFSPSFLPSNKAVSRRLIRLFSHLLIWSLSHLLIRLFLTFFLAV